MKKTSMITALVAAIVTIGSANAQPISKPGNEAKENSPGTTGAMGNVNANGVATDPGGVKQQQGDISKSTPGTVGAAPGATPPAEKKK